MKFVYLSENKIYLWNDGKVKEIQSERVAHYTDTVRSINKSKEWKETGTGANFIGTARMHGADEYVPTRINGIAPTENGLIYSVYLGGMGGIYNKSIENPNADEEHILTSMNTQFGGISLKDGKIAVSMDSADGCHVALVDMKGNYDEITGGDTIEEAPRWSKTDDRIFCSTAGYARDEREFIAAVSPRAIMAIDVKNNSIDELYADEKTDYLKPDNDANGNFYYIKQPYKEPKQNEPLWKDILLFPVRLVKAVIGFLNAFSVIFGGESLRGKQNNNDVKSKQKSEKQLYFEGRLIEAEKNAKANAAKGEKNAGIFPGSRVLVKIDSNGNETVIKKGILDYTVLEDGSIICSNGRYILHLKDNEEIVLTKAKLAHSMCIIN